MYTLTEWRILSEVFPTNQNALNILTSAVTKIRNNNSKNPFASNFSNLEAFANAFRLSPQELEALHSAGLFVNDGIHGYNLNQRLFTLFLQRMDSVKAKGYGIAV